MDGFVEINLNPPQESSELSVGGSKSNKKILKKLNFILGFILVFPSLPLQIYLIDNNVSVVQMASMGTLVSLPWSLKMVPGFIVDSVNVMNYGRKFFLVSGALFTCLFWFLLIFLHLYISFQFTSFLLMIIQIATVFHDVSIDSFMVSECKKLSNHGAFQAACASYRSFGSLIGVVVAIILMTMKAASISVVFLIETNVCLISVLLSVYVSIDHCASTEPQKTFKEQIFEVKNTLSYPYIKHLFAFILLREFIPGSGGAINYFLIDDLKFTPMQMGLLGVFAHLSMLIGTKLYEKIFISISIDIYFKYLLIISTCVTFIPYVLVSRFSLTLGIPDFLFTLGDDILGSAVSQLFILPLLMIISKACSSGSESSVYSSVLSFLNLASSTSLFTGGLLANFMNITKDSFHNLPDLIILSTLLSFIPLFFLYLIPHKSVYDIVRILQIYIETST